MAANGANHTKGAEGAATDARRDCYCSDRPYDAAASARNDRPRAAKAFCRACLSMMKTITQRIRVSPMEMEVTAAHFEKSDKRLNALNERGTPLSERSLNRVNGADEKRPALLMGQFTLGV